MVHVRLYRNLSPQYRKQRAWILKAADGSEIGLGTVDGEGCGVGCGEGCGVGCGEGCGERPHDRRHSRGAGD